MINSRTKIYSNLITYETKKIEEFNKIVMISVRSME